jgi:integrase
LQDVEKEQISFLYRRDLQKVGNDFLNYIKDHQLGDISPDQIQFEHIKAFLKLYKSSGSYYMVKRQTLGGLFYRLLDKNLILQNPVHDTTRMKLLPNLHRPFGREQLKQVLDTLFKRHPNLHLCTMLMYGCMLRPHQELRSLCRGDFSEDMKVISLAGIDNKSRGIRSVIVPVYVSELLEKRGTCRLKDSDNIFTCNCEVYNEHYFNTAWTRIKSDLLKEGRLVSSILYSFRHTAAINVYQKTKDPYKLQRLMGHSFLAVTLTYLRNLGLMVNADKEEDLPDLV